MHQLIYGLLSIFIILICIAICITGLCNYKSWTDSEMKTFLIVFAFTVVNSVLLAAGHLL